jgi:quercetin dioxygenase-like cupin family protein
VNKNLRDLISYSPGGVMSKVIVKSDKLNVTLFCMAAGTDISEHTSTREGTVHVLEGEGTFTLDGEANHMKPGVLIHMRRGQPHSIAVKKDTSFLLTLSE